MRRSIHFTGAESVQLTRCHRTYYIVSSTLGISYSSATSQFPAIWYQATLKELVVPSWRSRKRCRVSIFARADAEDFYNPAAGMALQLDYMKT